MILTTFIIIARLTWAAAVEVSTSSKKTKEKKSAWTRTGVRKGNRDHVVILIWSCPCAYLIMPTCTYSFASTHVTGLACHSAPLPSHGSSPQVLRKRLGLRSEDHHIGARHHPLLPRGAEQPTRLQFFGRVWDDVSVSVYLFYVRACL